MASYESAALDTVKPKRVLLANPRGYCAGVERAVATVKRALREHGSPVYVRKEIVHNQHVVRTLTEQGVIFVEETDEVPEGALVVFSAHGVSPAVHEHAARRDLRTIDATCPLVTKVHREAVRFNQEGFDILLIGHANAQIAVLTAANEELAARLAKLEHLLSRNSGNSSMPPSKDDEPGKTPPAGKKRPGGGPTRARGKQRGAPGANLAWTDAPNARRDRFPEGGGDCGHDLAGARDLGITDRYQQHEIPLVSVKVTQYDLHSVRCGCGKVHTVSRPEGARSGPVGYGPNLRAFAVYLMVAHFVPVQRCVELLESLTGATPSAGFVHGLLTRTARLLVEVDERIRALITLAYAVCCDDPLRVGPKKPKPGRKKAEKYLLVACTELYTHYLLGDRDLATFKAFVLSDLAGSVIVHDRYQNYDSAELGTLTHQLCCSHLLRDLDGAGELYPDTHWPTQIADALRGLIHQANPAREQGRDTIDDIVRNTLITLFRDGVLVGLSDTTGHGDRPSERKARLLLEVLCDREGDVLRFAHDLLVPATSNQAERDLRPSKTQQKISGRLTSEQRTRDRYTIRGYVSAAAKHGRNMMDALRDAVLGLPWMPSHPAPG